MRNPTIPLTRIVAQVIEANNESKQTQFVGSNQIVAKRQSHSGSYDAAFTLTHGFQAVGTCIAIFQVTVTPSGLADNNFMVSNVTPNVTNPNGSRFGSYENGQLSPINSVFCYRIALDNRLQDIWYIGIIGAQNRQLRLKIYVDANVDTTFKWSRIA